MKWIIKDKQSEQRFWNKWFAWYPVKVGYYRVWLEHVLRRKDPSDYDFWEYGNYISKKTILRDDKQVAKELLVRKRKTLREGRQLSKELLESVDKERYNCADHTESS